MRALDGAGWLRPLTADDRPIATRLDFELGGRLYMLENAIDPGHLTHSYAVETAITGDVHEVDFLCGDHPCKRRWSTGERHLVAVDLRRPGLAGQIAHSRSRVVRRLAQPS